MTAAELLHDRQMEALMSNPVIFKELPATFPEVDEHKTPAAAGSIIFHIILVTTLVLIPLVMPERIESTRFLALIAPLPPPPPPPPPPAPGISPRTVHAPKIRPVELKPDALVMPVAIPKEITRIVDDAPEGGVIGGVPGGIPGGVIGGAATGVLGGILAATLRTTEVAPPPPPPPPPVVAPPPPPKVAAAAAPIRVSEVQAPKVLKMVPPVYPAIALKARVRGVVRLEATLTKEGTVDAIRVISGHPLLAQAAVDCVKQWLYEPTYLNGEPVAIILTATINFELAPVS